MPSAIELRDAPLAAAHVGDEQDVGLAAGRRKHVDDAKVIAQRRRQRTRARPLPKGPMRRAAGDCSRRSARRPGGFGCAQSAYGQMTIPAAAGASWAAGSRECSGDMSPAAADAEPGGDSAASAGGPSAASGASAPRDRRTLQRKIDASEQRAACAARALRRIFLFADRTDADVPWATGPTLPAPRDFRKGEAAARAQRLDRRHVAAPGNADHPDAAAFDGRLHALAAARRPSHRRSARSARGRAPTSGTSGWLREPRQTLPCGRLSTYGSGMIASSSASSGACLRSSVRSG